jgi:PPOX class probable F420-dependent enzyme
MASALEALKNDRYLSLETFKKDGTGVKTPVWFVEVDNKLIVFTDGNSYKVKRIDRNPKARVAACSASGKVHGPWFDATARIVPASDDLAKRGYEGLQKRYGFQYSLLTIGAKISGSIKRRTIIAIDPA